MNNDEPQPLQHLIVESDGNNYVLENVSMQKRGGSYLSHWKINKKQPFQFTNLDASSFQHPTSPTNKKTEKPRRKSEKKEVTFEQETPQIRKKRSIIDLHDPHQNLTDQMKISKSMSIPALFPENKDYTLTQLESVFNLNTEEKINQDPRQNERRQRRKTTDNFATDKRYSVPSVYNFNQFRETIDDSTSDGSYSFPQFNQITMNSTSSQNSSQSSQTKGNNNTNVQRRYSLKNEQLKKNQQYHVSPPNITKKNGSPTTYNMSTRKSVSGPTTTVYMNQDSLHNSFQQTQKSTKRKTSETTPFIYQFENYSIEKESKKCEIKRGDPRYFGQNSLENYSLEKSQNRGTGVTTFEQNFSLSSPDESKVNSPRAKLSIKDVLN